MTEVNVKEKIFQATMGLINSGKGASQITMRMIASQAGVNTALVNYYYQSKDNLLGQVVGTIMGDIISQIMKNDTEPKDPIGKLRSMLITTTNVAFENVNVCKIALSGELKVGCRNSCEMVIPFLKDISRDVTQSEVEIIAMQLMIPFHYIFLDPELYGKLLDTDFFDEAKRNQKINQMIDCALAGLPNNRS